MDIRAHDDMRKKQKKRSFLRVFIRTSAALLSFLGMRLKNEVVFITRQARLFVGIAFVIIGLFSFSADKFCDGNSSSYYACTRPSTYYFYSWWSIALLIIGSFLIVLWFLRRNK